MTPRQANGVATPIWLSPVAGTAPQPTDRPPTPSADPSAADPIRPGATATPIPNAPPRLVDPVLVVVANTVDDLEGQRMAATNRLRALRDDYGLPEYHPAYALQTGIAAGLEDLEKAAVRELQKAMRRHPLGAWVDSTIGVGLKQAARLLAAIGDPYWNTLHNRPRTVSELWAYCGLHTLPGQGIIDTPSTHTGEGGDPDQRQRDTQQSAVRVAARRRKGQKANWSSDAKMRAYLIAESCVKNRRSPYRAVYDDRREDTAVTHPEWTPGHSHNDALRIVSKAVLKDLWRAARDARAEYVATDVATDAGHVGPSPDTPGHISPG